MSYNSNVGYTSSRGYVGFAGYASANGFANIDPVAKWTPNYNGAQHVEFKSWTAINDFRIEFDYYINHTPHGVHIMVFGDIRHPDYYSLYYAGNATPYYYLKIGTPDSSENIIMSYRVTDVLMATYTNRHCAIERINGVLSCYIDDILLMQGVFIGPLAVNRLGGGTRDGEMMHEWIGEIKSFRLIDLENPQNSRDYSSIIESREMPTSKILIDSINREDGELIGFAEDAIWTELGEPVSVRAWSIGNNGDDYGFSRALGFGSLDPDSWPEFEEAIITLTVHGSSNSVAFASSNGSKWAGADTVKLITEGAAGVQLSWNGSFYVAIDPAYSDYIQSKNGETLTVEIESYSAEMWLDSELWSDTEGWID